MENFVLQGDGSFVVFDKGGFYRYSLSLLDAVVYDKPYLKFYIHDRSFLVKGSIKSLKEHLSSDFLQISRKVIVNMQFVKSVTKKNDIYELCTINDRIFEISKRRYSKNVTEIKEYYRMKNS